jgi:hypothetical protein
MSDYLYRDLDEPNKLSPPDSCVRLACAVHRFKVPRIDRKVDFAKAFKSVGQADKTRKLMLLADDQRERLDDALSGKLSAERVLAEAKRYQPMIHTILVSCKVQSEQARLDERLVFEWKSGVEENANSYKSEAIMFDLVMTIVCDGLGRCASAAENSMQGEFAAASRDYAAAAGVFEFLTNDHLPKWISKGNPLKTDEQLPSECYAPFTNALSLLFMANAQQMAVATVLVKPVEPNYSLVGKLCLGISDQLEDFLDLLRKEAFNQMSRLDKDFLTLLTFQIAIHKSLSLYFQARAEWNTCEYGIGIALMSEAAVMLNEAPDIASNSSLKIMTADLKDLRQHMAIVLRSWEKDNSYVFFQAVPQSVPAGHKLKEGLRMNKSTKYELEEAEPVLLKLPDVPLQRTDSDLARELHERLNAGEE